MSLPLQNFVDGEEPTINADWLNEVDQLKVTVFDNSVTPAEARDALTVAETFTPEKYGAVGDGVADDTVAMQLLSAAVNALGGGSIAGRSGANYKVCAQTFAGAAGQGYAYRAADVIKIENCTKPVVFEGNGCKFTVAGGLRFGAFNPVTGAPYASVPPFTDPDYAASVGQVMSFLNNTAVTVRNVEINGNLVALIVGGQWGDTGYQLPAYGVYDYKNEQFLCENVYSHHNGLDGFAVAYPGLIATDAKRPQTFINCRSLYNARQGMSWVGGIGLTLIDCDFSQTGRGANTSLGGVLTSSPGAGLDIEAESSVCRQGFALNSTFVNNAGVGALADSGDGGYMTFQDCIFWGTTNYSIWPMKPQMRFENCGIYGAAVNPYAATVPADGTVFLGCDFEDKPYPVVGVYGGILLDVASKNYVRCEGCTFTNNSQTLTNGLGAFVAAGSNFYTSITLKDCVFTQKAATPTGTAIVNLQGVAIDNCTFVNDAAVQPAVFWLINTPADVFVTRACRIVAKAAGSTDKLHWFSAAGPTNLIAADNNDAAGSWYPYLQLALAKDRGAAVTPMRVFSGHEIPSTQFSGIAFNVGDFCINCAPTARGVRAWRCTVAGTPGTWVSDTSTGTFTMAAANTKTVADINILATSSILMFPTNASAGTLMGGAKSLYISARTAATSFAVNTANAAAAVGDETFEYTVNN